MHRADRVADGDFRRAAVLLAGLDRLLEVAHVVERIEDTDDVNAVFDGLLDERIDHVVCIVLVAQNVLATEEHLQLRVGHRLAQLTQTLPRIFIQEAHAGVKRSATPAFQRIVADFIQLVSDGQHLVQTHTGCSLGLMRIAQNGIGDQHLAHCSFLLFMIVKNSRRPAEGIRAAHATRMPGKTRLNRTWK